MRSVLEAVHILLSDHSSNFICLIAVDSQIAGRAIESTMNPQIAGRAIESAINPQTCASGHEFLKKIVNLPFCLPKVGKEFEIELFGSVSGFSTYVPRLQQH